MMKTNTDNTVKSRKSIQMITDESGKIFVMDLFIDWRFIWFNSLISEPEGDNHQKENGVRAKFSKAGRSH